MKFRYNKFYFATAIVFVLAFLCLMFSYLTNAMFYPAMALFCAGFVLLSIAFIKLFNKQNAELAARQDELVMERTVNDGGETYVLQDSANDKKAKRQKSRQKFDRLMPAIFCIASAVLFAYLLMSTIVVNLMK